MINRLLLSFKNGALVCVLFGVAFCAFAVLSGSRALPQVYDYLEARRWIETPADIESLKIVYGHQNGTNTYSANAKYTYTIDGISYVGTQLGLVQNKDSNKKYWTAIQRKINAAQKQGQAVAWVNPNNPSQAVLDRSFRGWVFAFRMSMCFLFGLIGIGFLGIAMQSASSPDGEIHPFQRSLFRSGIIGGLILIGMGIFPYLFVSIKLTIGVVLSMLLSAFITFAGGYLLFKSWGLNRQLKKYGPTILTIKNPPARTGQPLIGSFETLGEIDHRDFKFNLICNETVHSGDYSNKKILWGANENFVVVTKDSKTTVEFSIEVPDHLPPSGSRGENAHVEWELKAETQSHPLGGQSHFERSWPIEMAS